MRCYLLCLQGHRANCSVDDGKKASAVKIMTYTDDASNKHQVPDQVFFALKLGAVLELAQVREDEVCIEQDSHPGSCQQEACYESIKSRRELEQ